MAAASAAGHAWGAGSLIADGRAVVERGAGLLAGMVAGLMRFPKAGRDVPVTVTFRVEQECERWRRTFGDNSSASTFESIQAQGEGGFDRLLSERFGPFSFGLALVVEDARLWLVVRRWSFAGLPLPPAWASCGKAYESAEDGRFNSTSRSVIGCPA